MELGEVLRIVVPPQERDVYDSVQHTFTRQIVKTLLVRLWRGESSPPAVEYAQQVEPGLWLIAAYDVTGN